MLTLDFPLHKLVKKTQLSYHSLHIPSPSLVTLPVMKDQVSL